MLKVIQICEKCKKESLPSDGDGGELTINYLKKTFMFVCPKCGHTNVFDFGDIKKALGRHTKLPSIRGYRWFRKVNRLVFSNTIDN